MKRMPGIEQERDEPQPFGGYPRQRASLPIYRSREKILYALKTYQTLVLVGETGSGKSTQVPQYLHEAGYTADGRVVACLQPRRVAAVSVAQRVAEERRGILGKEVGYAVRFDDCCDVMQTKIKYMTEGVLLREMMRDPLLLRYSAIMLDEAHERTLFLDVIAGLLKKLLRKRRDLRVIVSSATLDAEVFRDFFNLNSTNDPDRDTATILSVEGRSYPVQVFYAESPVPDYMTSVVETVVSIHLTQRPGDVLAFLTGQDEVDEAVAQIRQALYDKTRHASLAQRDVEVLPMYGGLPSIDQMKVFETYSEDVRKIIVATNIAEASVTIPGIVYVVDSGFAKLRAYDPNTRVESLVVTPISQASAEQRAGRAGRVRSGYVYRLYTEEAFKALDKATVPEMQRSDLAPVIVQLKALGIDNVLRFPFISPPPAKAMANALELLLSLEAIDHHTQLADPLGIQLAEFPLPPMQAKSLLSAGEFHCGQDMAIIVAMMQVQHVFLNPPNRRREAARLRLRFSTKEGDHLTLLNVYKAFVHNKCSPKWCHEHMLNYRSLVRAVEVCRQLRKMMKRFKVPLEPCDPDDPDAILRCLVKGHFANAARLALDGSYRSIRGDGKLSIHPSSVLYNEAPPRYVIYSEVMLTSEHYMRDISAVEPEWLSELAPHYYEFSAKSSDLPAGKRARLAAD